MKTALLPALALLLPCLLLGSRAAEPTHPPLPPLPTSPVATFRQLLAMEPSERTAILALRPEAQRRFLQLRLAEYEGMGPAVRDERLRATDLYWHLQQLILRSPAERSTLLAAAPADLQPVLAERLALWDRMPAADRESLVHQQLAIKYFAQLREIRPPPLPPVGASVSAAPPVPLQVQAELTRLKQLSVSDLARVHEEWQRFLESPSPRRDRALETMDSDERVQMQQVLDRFRRLTPEQRRACVGSFTRFALMPAGERVEFLKNVERWEALTAQDRESWRAIVNKLPVFLPLPISPSSPPLPAAPTARRLVTETHAQASVP